MQKIAKLIPKKFTALTQYLEALPSYQVPQGGFYLWLDTGCPSEQICVHLYQHFGIKALPGHYLAISADAVNDYQKLHPYCPCVLTGRY